MRQLSIAALLFCLMAVQAFSQTTKPAAGGTDFPKSPGAEKAVMDLLSAAKANDLDAMAKLVTFTDTPPDKAKAVLEKLAKAFAAQGDAEVHASAESDGQAMVLLLLRPKASQPGPTYTTDPTALRFEGGQWKIPYDRAFMKAANAKFQNWAEANRVQPK